ncbi:MAG: glycine cleavage system protein GcvH [Alphaproteobacteria bacterium]|nr:glycine cleavage system protein GcvH [Alphaproteobacteria bacterium]
MGDVKYSEEHEWIEIDGDTVTVGITKFAQEQLGDIVFVELPEVGAELESGGEAGVVESVKAASEVYAPVSGEVVEINDSLESTPELVNDDAEGEAWFFKMRLSDPAELDDLMNEKAYRAFCAEQG